MTLEEAVKITGGTIDYAIIGGNPFWSWRNMKDMFFKYTGIYKYKYKIYDAKQKELEEAQLCEAYRKQLLEHLSTLSAEELLKYLCKYIRIDITETGYTWAAGLSGVITLEEKKNDPR